ncbi:hypothetical protein [Iodidimonas sp. SYSU 1G8]|uniref:phage adaptor protein n=1 Tax=Iodidimonas sp. SYSU 1G8 TaxID=3133967 RepID=UPI0031FEA7F6
MSIASLDELKHAVANQFVTAEVVAHLPAAIRLVEANINRNVRVRRMMGRATAELTGPFLSLPDDFLAAAGLQLNGAPTRRLEFRTAEALDALKRVHAAGGTPVWYSLIGGEIEVLPAPDGVYEAELTYYRKLTPLSDAAPANWLLTDYPDVYFHGTLALAGPYVNDPRSMSWAALYDAALEQMILEDDRARFPQGRVAIRPVGVLG